MSFLCFTVFSVRAQVYFHVTVPSGIWGFGIIKGFSISTSPSVLAPFLSPRRLPISLLSINTMRTAVKKTTAKAPAKTTGATGKAQIIAHPSWVDMIKECIVAHPDDARAGVSRPTIKKFVESKYRIELNAAASSQLNRAITTGSEKGTFVLPKGPSGKVKLAPKARVDAAKENTKPISKRSAASKPVTAKPKAAISKPAATKKPTASRPVGTKATATAKTATKPTAPTKKYTSAAKKLPVKKTATTTKKTAIAKKPSTAAKKPTTAKKGIAKKGVTGEAKKPAAAKLKAKAAPATKAKPASKKPASKAKPASKSLTTKKPASNKA